MERDALAALMDLALVEAEAATRHDDVPIGAVVALTETGEVVGRGHNQREQQADPTAHAEVLALREAAERLSRWRLDDCTLVVTLEPCPMCAGAALNARIGAIAFGAPDPKAGATGSLYNLAADPRLNHETTVIAGVRSDESAALLRAFFAERR